MHDEEASYRALAGAGLLSASDWSGAVPLRGRTAVSQTSLEPTGHWMEKSFGDAALPPMGWNSWNAFHTQIDEAKLLGSAQAIVDSGLRELGYRYINIDDGWWQKRRVSPMGAWSCGPAFSRALQGRIPSRRASGRSSIGCTPSGSRPASIRTSDAMPVRRPTRNPTRCCRRAPWPNARWASMTTSRRISLCTFQEWGFDYIKVDGCGLNAFSPDKSAVMAGQFRPFPAYVVSDSINQTRVSDIRDLYGRVRDALIRVRPLGTSCFRSAIGARPTCVPGDGTIGNLWRTSDDIEPRWARMLYNFDSVVTRELYSGPGHWNDPDMLYIGQGEFDANHLTEARTHFALWAIVDAPLIIGYDLRQAPKPLLDILGAARDRRGQSGSCRQPGRARLHER
jgi:alpha-galactosidase